MHFDNSSKPTLVEPGVKYFLKETLKQCRQFKNTYNNLLFNICLGVAFFFILGTVLIIKYKGKLTTEEINEKTRVKQQYILSKIKNYQNAKRVAQQELISGLPHWDRPF